MSSRRVLKAAEAIREVVSTAILLEIRDPRVRDVTVTRVEVSGDMRNAKIFVSVMGDEAKENLCLFGLRNSAGFLQQKVGQRIDTRYIPKLSFEIDKGVKNSLKVAELLNEIRREGGLHEDERSSEVPVLPEDSEIDPNSTASP
ncbi:MAG: 30S ribosome-binding factor RbfA [Planctomycetaceae bacterium]|nr:30S ribosome-binding factor RbfA [Planctomycetaceae bacterium]